MFYFLADTRELELLFEDDDATAIDTEHREEIIPETLRLRALGGFVLPLLGAGNGAEFYFVQQRGIDRGRYVFVLWRKGILGDTLGERHAIQQPVVE